VFQQIKTLKDVVDWGLCTGCGACYYACGQGAITLKNVPAVGIRPHFNTDACKSCTKCLSICPGYSVDGNLEIQSADKPTPAEEEFGAALEIWEGHARDTEIRYRASSGGLLSAIALYCLEAEGMEFVLHTDSDAEQPWLNRTVKSKNRKELLARTGSRYAPSSPCEDLQSIETSEGPCVFIGKPCDTAAVAMLRRQNPALDKKLGLVMTFFCAGTPSTQGTLDLITSLKVDSREINTVRYRGEGWPGRFKVRYDQNAKEESLSYVESWGKLTGYRSLRCNLCPDGLGRVADISCGDAWEKHTGDDDPGRSLVIVRTQRGKQILHGAIAAGYVDLEPVGPTAVCEAQRNLLQRRKELFGRFLAMRLFAVPRPFFPGFSLWHSWIRQPAQIKFRTVFGTIRRVVQRKWWKRCLVTDGR